MATHQTISCDQCSKDITEGDGRQWHVCLYSQVIPMKESSTPRVDQGEVIGLMHFCDEKCTADWATAAAATKAQRQTAYEADQAAKAAAAQAAAESAPPQQPGE